MRRRLHTVVETPEFLRRSARLLEGSERAALIDYLGSTPDAGVVMEGSGGARKLRWAISGRGKSGGIRVITFYAGPRIPVFVLTAFGKNEKANLTKAERNALHDILGAIVTEYEEGVRQNVQSWRKHPQRR